IGTPATASPEIPIWTSSRRAKTIRLPRASFLCQQGLHPHGSYSKVQQHSPHGFLPATMYTNSLRFPGPVRRLGSSDYQADRRGREPVKPCQVFLKLEMQPGWPEILRRSQLSAYLPATHGAAREESGTATL